MRHFYLFILFVAFVWAACDNPGESETDDAHQTIQAVANSIDGVVHSTGNWEPHLPAGDRGVSAGNHRAVIELDSIQSMSPVVVAEIKWRLPEDAPWDSGLFLFDAATMDTVHHVTMLQKNSHSGIIAFEPLNKANRYFAYYLPYETTGGYYPRLEYVTDTPTPAAQKWLDSLGRDINISSNRDHFVETTEIQSVDDFHSFFPMEVAASAEEVAELLAVEQIGEREFYYFPEDRSHAISMRHNLPYHWAKRGLQPQYTGVAQRGEYYTFQIGIYSPHKALANLTVELRDLYRGDDVSIPAAEITCFTCSGIDLHGKPFTKTIDVDSATVQALWFGVKIPENATTGEHKSVFGIRAANTEVQFVPIEIHVDRRSVENNGDDNPEKMSRLAWLNSTMGRDPNFIIDPFVPVEVEQKTVTILGREVTLGPAGLPNSIRSYFSPFVTDITDNPQDIISAPIGVKITSTRGAEEWTASDFSVQQDYEGAAYWSASSESESFTMAVRGTIEYDGMLDYKIELVAKSDISVQDISIPIAYEKDAAELILGLGHKGQARPDNIEWKWDVTNHHEGVWLGGVNKGLQYVLRDENYERPLNTNFYQNKPLNLPTSWHNDGNGGIDVTASEDEVVANNYSGARQVFAGDTLNFNVRFLITPFKPVDTETHFNTRFVHKYVPVDTARAWGGTVVNIHHANEINPYINYPFYNLDQQTDYIQEAHRKDVKVKLYNTIRELTYKAHELMPMRSLGTEIFNDGDGGGHSWLQEHLRGNYHSAWHAWRVDDAAILNKGTSRWTNYYIEGLNWLAKNQDIDGLYLDDIAFSRETVKRMVSVLYKNRDEVIIDLHSANQFNERDGFLNSAFLYMEHFPFVNRLWFGEYFEYDRGPDYWMTEVAGLPFGLMGEMLEGGGHPYRGMLYGMFTRYWGDTDPSPVWNVLDEYGIESSKMIGYWIDDAPVVTRNENIYATTYVKPGKVLIALASWSDNDENVSLAVDWTQLGIDPAQAVVTIPAVDGLQTAFTTSISALNVPANQGLFVLIE